MNTLLVAGGDRDPNIASLLRAADERAIDVLPLLVGEGHSPSVTWELDSNEFWVNGKRVDVAGVFMRRDVFHAGGSDADHRASAWHASLQGWLAGRQTVRVLHRRCLDRHFNKLHVLGMAKAANLSVPETLVTNAVDSILKSRQPAETIAKPVAGGGFCRRVDSLPSDLELRAGVAASPAIVQPLLEGPDLRIYGIGDKHLCFRIDSDSVDYRNSSKREISEVDRLPSGTIDGLRRLTEQMGLDWWAADLKMCGVTRDPVFLEVNSNPMFSAFDSVAGGAVTEAILNYLLLDR